MMRGIFLKTAVGLALAGVITAANAQERPFAPRMTCAAVTALVAKSGAAVISTGTYTYDRYVSDDRFCPVDQTTTPAWTNTADNQQCFIGYRCKERFDEEDGRD
jgi:hypothetical protein